MSDESGVIRLLEEALALARDGKVYGATVVVAGPDIASANTAFDVPPTAEKDRTPLLLLGLGEMAMGRLRGGLIMMQDEQRQLAEEAKDPAP